MNDEEVVGGEDPRGWLMEPLGPGEVRVHVDIGESVEVSDELRRALGDLVNELYASEVEGYALPARGDCDPWYSCWLRKCQPHYSTPCFVDTVCKIQKVA
jgi:hypothetical protein